jgi:hypothetical protein
MVAAIVTQRLNQVELAISLPLFLYRCARVRAALRSKPGLAQAGQPVHWHLGLVPDAIPSI